jgi:hypothetical protein
LERRWQPDALEGVFGGSVNYSEHSADEEALVIGHGRRRHFQTSSGYRTAS